VNERRFLNRSQPQTLYIAVILCYIDLVRNLLTPSLGGLVLAGIALAAGGYGIANEQKWGYSLAVGASVFQVILLFGYFGSDTLTALGPLLDLLFDGALVALLLHPLSRDYQRIWFR
jgi:hypothetical protein